MAYTFKHGDRPIEGVTIQRAVGRGGFGEVYYALTDSGKQVAVKYLRENPDVELRGIAHVMNLKSPHLITIYDVRHNEEGEPFVIMEYVSGPSLRDLMIAEPRGLGVQKAAFFMRGIAAGLSYLHERGIVHRDLKPGNIFYDDGYIKIGDYGLSKHISVSAHSGNTISVGTVHYMAPEIGSGSYSKSIDIYALGVMLFEMLSGRLPFTGSSMGEILMRHLSEKPDMSGIPEPFASVIAKALAKDPKDRWEDVDEMVEALTSVSEVSESLASFDASILAHTPRTPSYDGDRTVTTPPPASPVLDVREQRIDLPSIPPIPPILSPSAAKKARKLQLKAQKLQEKAQKQARVVQARLATMGIGPGVAAPAEPVRLRGGRKRWQQVVIYLITLFAVAGGMGIMRDDEAVFGTSLLFLMLGSLGTMLAYKLSARRNAVEYEFQDRMLYTACGFVCLLPGFAAGSEVNGIGRELFGRLLIPMAATLLLFNWNERIQMGRRQIISGGNVFWHGLVGLLIASIATRGRFALDGGVLCATLLVLVQMIAGLWPITTGAVAGATAAAAFMPRGRRMWNRVEGVYQRVSNAVERMGTRLEKTGENLEEPADTEAKPDEKPEQTPSTAEAPAAQGAAQPAPPAMSMQYPQPSFVGRTANAGLSFLAKLLLLAGLAMSLMFCTHWLDISVEGTQIQASAGRVSIVEHNRPQVDVQIPRALIILPLMLGMIMLVVARRNDGAAHFIRGFLGCVFIFATTFMIIGRASVPLGVFLAGGDMDNTQTDALIQAGLLLAVAIVLMFWPKKQSGGAIVI